LALSQILTLYTTPVVYIYLDQLQSWIFGGREKKEAGSGHVEPQPANDRQVIHPNCHGSHQSDLATRKSDRGAV